MKIRKMVGIITVTVFIAVSLLAGGCATKSGSARQVDRSDWEWVPSVWVEDNSFTGNQYSHCAYDQETTWYLCPPGTR
jgi:hypothetical protein